MTSRGSPDSTIRPQRVRQPSRTRWLCTAAVASSAGIGATSGAPAARSESTRISSPQRDRARGAAAERVERALERAPAAARVERAVERDGAEAVAGSARSLARSPLVSTGCAMARRRAWSGDSSSRLPCAPTAVRRLITSVSRCGSMAGFVTCAKSCLKKPRSSRGRLRERGQRRVDAHRARAAPGRRAPSARRCRAAPRRVAEEPQVALERVLRGRLDRRRGDVLEVDLLLVEQRAVGPAPRERALDLVVAADAPGVGVDDQHLAGAQAVVDDDVGRVEIEHAGLGREHEQPVARDLVAAGAQAVAVERRARLAPVAERDRRRAVPRLEHAGVELVERAQVVRHRRRLAPGGRDQHRERVRGRAPASTSSSKAASSAAESLQRSSISGKSFGQVVAELCRAQLRLARVHPLRVAAHGVDLAVVREVVERVREIPRAERVGREARVHERHRRLDLGLAQIGVVGRQLAGREQALVGERAARERGDVERRLRHAACGGGELDAAADDRQLAPERALVARRALRDQQLAHDGLALAREAADGRWSRAARRASRAAAGPPRRRCARTAPRSAAAARDRSGRKHIATA